MRAVFLLFLQRRALVFLQASYILLSNALINAWKNINNRRETFFVSISGRKYKLHWILWTSEFYIQKVKPFRVFSRFERPLASQKGSRDSEDILLAATNFRNKYRRNTYLVSPFSNVHGLRRLLSLKWRSPAGSEVEAFRTWLLQGA